MALMAENEPLLNLKNLPAPVCVTLELTYNCSASCPGCPKWNKETAENEMNADEWIALIDDLSRYIGEFRLSGGEPVNNPDFSRILSHIEKKKIPYIIMTSGLWFDAENVISILKDSSSLKSLMFSIHGPNDFIHNSFVKYDMFNSAIENIKRSVAAGFPVQTSSVLNNTNKGLIKGIISLVFQLGSKAHIFHRYQGFVHQGLSLNREDFGALLDYIGKIREGGLPVFPDGCFPACFNNSGFHCPAGITHCSIDPFGNVKPCPFSQAIFGNIRESAAKKIWNRKRFRKWALQVPDACFGCTVISECLGGCHALRERFLIKRDPLMEEPI